eukprot:6315009-Pyramimonas_sp.AAC.2
MKAMEREHEALVEKAKQKKLDAATEPSGADLESPSASKGPKGMPKKIGTAPTPARKRPAAAPTTAPRTAKQAKLGHHIPKPSAMPKPPSPGESVCYRGGKILASESKGGWRAWPIKEVVGKEKPVVFGKSKAASFSVAIGLIDAALDQ